MDGKPWFAPKRYGYGTGLPITWQGWAVLGGYLALILGMTVAAGAYPNAYTVIGSTVVVAIATLAFILFAKNRTRGGWLWRWGE